MTYKELELANKLHDELTDIVTKRKIINTICKDYSLFLTGIRKNNTYGNKPLDVPIPDLLKLDFIEALDKYYEKEEDALREKFGSL